MGLRQALQALLSANTCPQNVAAPLQSAPSTWEPRWTTADQQTPSVPRTTSLETTASPSARGRLPYPVAMLPLSRIPHAIAVPVLLAIFVVCAIVSVKDDAVTFDETPHLGAGVSALERGDFRLNPEHPPLVKMIAAAPVVALGRGGGDYASEVWRGEPSGGSGGARTGASEWIFGFELLFGSRNSAIRRDPAARIFPARCAMIALGAVLCLLVYGWTREMRGADAGLLALALAVTCPTILAHARLVATDLPEGLGIVATIWAHWRWTRKPTWPRALLTGAALGAALLIKFNGALLAPIVVVLVVAAVAAGRVPARRAAGAIALVAGTAYLS